MHTIGSTKLWLPSLRSVDSHLGGLSIIFEGHWRSGRFKGVNLRYFLEGSLSLDHRELAFEGGGLWRGQDDETNMGILSNWERLLSADRTKIND